MAAFLPIDSLTINAAANYLHGHQSATVSPYPNPYATGGSVPFEAKLQQLPKWTGSISALYDIVRTDYGVWRLDADANFTTSYYSVPNVSTAIGGYTLINGRFSLAEIPVGRGRLNVSAVGQESRQQELRDVRVCRTGDRPAESNVTRDDHSGNLRASPARMERR